MLWPKPVQLANFQDLLSQRVLQESKVWLIKFMYQRKDWIIGRILEAYQQIVSKNEQKYH